jgi:hypothetical protein
MSAAQIEDSFYAPKREVIRKLSEIHPCNV